ncbi:MAG TPA: hypothetical protein VEA80_06485 [Vitreimonas sp.]|uniref:hypothetical protein n=1 Tax=Vitreimonas sp. TaxID=3069702 RepID=UPI002D6725C7|nr:hypothetical protein [Vitreimonas sp.]HYD87100.1 hypothetical protein [Vitreimonas sp.]
MLGSVIDWAKFALLALSLVDKLVDWVEREQLRGELQRENFRKQVEKHHADVAAARAIRERTRAELDAAPDKLREHPDAHFRD